MRDRARIVPSTAERPSIGVCLSAGGFRSALYGLGAFRYLAEASLLDRVVAVSSVSGGSILAAWLAERWPALRAAPDSAADFDRLALHPFWELLATRNLRNRWLARWLSGRLAGRRTGRGWAFAAALDEQVLSTGPLRELPDALQVVFTSTDLGSGQPVRLAAEFVGAASYGYAEPPSRLRLATAVAASAAEPSYFSPLHLPAAQLGLGEGSEVLSLVDGGVFDNLGTEWFEDWEAAPRPPAARRPDFLVVVDAAGPFAPVHHRVGSVAGFFRAPGIADAHMRSERVTATRRSFDRGDLRGVLVSLREPLDDTDAPFPLSDRETCELLARLRTDLDRFLPLESMLLAHAGYRGLHARLRRREPELAVAEPTWQLDLPDLDLAAALRRGARRVAMRR